MQIEEELVKGRPAVPKMDPGVAATVQLQEGLEIQRPDEVRLEATRYLFLGLDVITPARKKDRPQTKRGGDEIDTRCLKRTAGFLPRAFITPLEPWAEWMPKEYLPEGARAIKNPISSGLANAQGGAGFNGVYAQRQNLGILHYPGEDIVFITLIPAETNKGIVEIKKLVDVDWEYEKGGRLVPGDAQKANQLFFPDDQPLSPTLRGLRKRVEEVRFRVQDPDIRDIADDMLEGMDMSYNWAVSTIDRENTQLKRAQAHQWTYVYSPQVRLLMDQLEMKPQDNAFQVLASNQSRMIEGMGQSGITPEYLQGLQEQNAQLVESAVSRAMEAAGKVFGEVLRETFTFMQKPQETKETSAAEKPKKTEKPSKEDEPKF